MSDLKTIQDLLAKKPKKEGAEEKFEEKMTEIRLKEKEAETQTLAASLNLPYINLAGFAVSPEALTLLPKDKSAELKAIAFLYSGDEVRMAAVEPKNPALQEILFQITERTHTKGGLYLISQHSFDVAFKLYDILPTPRVIVSGVQITEDELKRFEAELKDVKEFAARIKGANVTDLVTMTIASALKAGASDIHIEAEEKQIVFRFRLDGALTDIASVSHERWREIISRIKLLSGLKINITTAPQDGRFTIFLTNDKVDVRVSAIPTSFGESVVMRLLRSAVQGLSFEDLGIRGKAFLQLQKEISRPNGMIITTGPTGSGKTTTLYAILNKLKNPEIKIITLEDPVEYKLEGINQSQIDASKEYTFAKGLRSILRQDPDIIMVGEIRDLETADTAIQAALTGHLVISTLHTNDAAGAIPRFLSMGTKPFLLAPALNAVIGQRLVRKICSACAVEDKLDEETLKRVVETLKKIPPQAEIKINLKNLKFFKGGGCSECHGTGYKGRIGIYEVLAMNKQIEQVILGGEISEYKMREIASEHGMVTMAADGLLKALDKITSVEEVFSVAE
ncbi:type II/IV secretion system protein [Candidatus Uhrbacteria bacterium]|nr:type II/IV secretion system protein [Candidatus Uhrbacteria bacterium]